MSLAGLRPKSGSWHVYLIIASTGQQGLVLYKGDKGVNVAARTLEDDSAKAGAFWPWICHWFWYPFWHSCQTAQLKPGKMLVLWHNHHHYHVLPPALISLTLSRHPSLSSIAPGRSFKATSCISTELLCR